jgi:hypothetical protein
MLDLAVFVPRLKQVIAWTEHLMQNFAHQYNALDNSRIFRQINPLVNGRPLYIFNRDAAFWSVDWSVPEYGPNKFEQALQLAIRQREEALKKTVASLEFRELGRILYLETDLTTCDGAAEFQSNGFIDGSDVPPIDTWFYLDQDIRRQDRRVPNLFCCIPKKFEPIMEEAIRVEIFDSYHWLDESGPLTHQQIVAAMSA